MKNKRKILWEFCTHYTENNPNQDGEFILELYNFLQYYFVCEKETNINDIELWNIEDLDNWINEIEQINALELWFENSWDIEFFLDIQSQVINFLNTKIVNN